MRRGVTSPPRSHGSAKIMLSVVPFRVRWRSSVASGERNSAVRTGPTGCRPARMLPAGLQPLVPLCTCKKIGNLGIYFRNFDHFGFSPTPLIIADSAYWRCDIGANCKSRLNCCNLGSSATLAAKADRAARRTSTPIREFSDDVNADVRKRNLNDIFRAQLRNGDEDGEKHAASSRLTLDIIGFALSVNLFSYISIPVSTGIAENATSRVIRNGHPEGIGTVLRTSQTEILR